MKNASKIRDFVIGFFGWMLIGNLLSLLLLNLNSDELHSLIMWLLTITAILALFFKKRTWFGIGVVTNVVIHVVFWTIRLAGASVSDILSFASFPFPMFFLLAAN